MENNAINRAIIYEISFFFGHWKMNFAGSLCAFRSFQLELFIVEYVGNVFNKLHEYFSTSSCKILGLKSVPINLGS